MFNNDRLYYQNTYNACLIFYPKVREYMQVSNALYSSDSKF